MRDGSRRVDAGEAVSPANGWLLHWSGGAMLNTLQSMSEAKPGASCLSQRLP